MASASSLLEPKAVMCLVWTRTTTEPCCIALTSAGRRWERIEADEARSFGAALLMTNTSTMDRAEPASSHCGRRQANALGRFLLLPPQPAGEALHLARRQP